MKQTLTNQEKYLLDQKKHKQNIRFLRILVFVIFIGLWEAAARLGWINDFIFSSPTRIIICFWEMLCN